MSYFFRSRLMKAFQSEREWDESKHPRHPAGAEGSKGGEFAPAGEGGGEVRPSAAMMDQLGPAAFDNPAGYDRYPARHPGESAAARTVAMLTAQAYADAQPGKGGASDADYNQRKLNYIAPNALSAVDAATVLPKVIAQYNEFNPKKVTARILAVAPDAKVWVGREMSPVLYITGPEKQLANLIKLAPRSLKADEYDVYGAGHQVVDYSADRAPGHSGPGKAGFPVLHTFDQNVLRLWWD